MFNLEQDVLHCGCFRSMSSDAACGVSRSCQKALNVTHVVLEEVRELPLTNWAEHENVITAQ